MSAFWQFFGVFMENLILNHCQFKKDNYASIIRKLTLVFFGIKMFFSAQIRLLFLASSHVSVRMGSNKK